MQRKYERGRGRGGRGGEGGGGKEEDDRTSSMVVNFSLSSGSAAAMASLDSARVVLPSSFAFSYAARAIVDGDDRNGRLREDHHKRAKQFRTSLELSKRLAILPIFLIDMLLQSLDVTLHLQEPESELRGLVLIFDSTAEEFLYDTKHTVRLE